MDDDDDPASSEGRNLLGAVGSDDVDRVRVIWASAGGHREKVSSSRSCRCWQLPTPGGGSILYSVCEQIYQFGDLGMELNYVHVHQVAI